MERPKFIVNQMCGRLAKWLRLIGYDAVYFSDIAGRELINIAKKESRIILTRDTELIKRSIIAKGIVKALMVNSDNLDVQLAELIKSLKLNCSQSLKRCIECNVELKPIPKSEVKSEVPLHVYKTQNNFSVCPLCGRYYWKGTHWKHIQNKLKNIC
ncbi:Mut7-C RNAse domain-containing protein [Candidatus Oleimmundimicrobium sp.]|uniref:Mut7-C RNAse domain-containing protein n=1 Tax=Candidatus Oleimmundimicrobium sp. TaxID=3060597 RepID=UPI002726EF06|nr:Mut7-C RNAse domain-containing protein [Candidatus Oleimmundimicrobium sp.]MDO8885327.1 Mut7-C RNAse domain-containing protein [Candidatus Oleimmundimicrobium sp.]